MTRRLPLRTGKAEALVCTPGVIAKDEPRSSTTSAFSLPLCQEHAVADGPLIRSGAESALRTRVSGAEPDI